MQTQVPQELLDIHAKLEAITLNWALERRLDDREASRLRRRAAELCHDHYRATIPAYRKVCARMKVEGPASYETIRSMLLVPDDVFKSYPQRYIDESRFDRMNEWLSGIASFDLAFDASGVRNVDDWLARLEREGVNVAFSSGTSGHISFVPRDERTWRAFTELPFLYVAANLGHRGLLPAWTFALLKQLARRVRPSRFVEVVRRVGLRASDGFFFNFSGGNQGVQLAGQEIGRLTRSAHFLYEKKMSAAAVRAIVRGARTPEEAALADEFLDTTVRRKGENYERLLRELEASAARGRRVVVFGTPAVLLEACRILEQSGRALELPRGSSITYGGGWKSFDGERIPEDELVRRITRAFGVERAAVSEGYSMTEIQGIMQKCERGRFHVPPLIDVTVYGEDLAPRAGDDVRGTLGVIDPFALSYPGFVLTGDNVRLLRTPCACGLPGETIVRVERSPGKDVKGCGGIMARVNA